MAKAEIRSLEFIGIIENLAAEVREDLDAFGPNLASYSNGKYKVQKKLVKAFESLKATEKFLKTQRIPYLRQQFKNLGMSEKSTNLKLHIGSGPCKLRGWVNIDFFPAELSMNLKWGLPFATDSASFVFCSHMLEHVYFREEALFLLSEFRRVLKPGGVLRVIVPDIGECMKAYARRDLGFFKGRYAVWPWAKSRRTLLAQFLGYAGAGLRPGRSGHKYGYDYDTLKLLLTDAGFKSVRKSSFMASSYPELRVDKRSRVAQANYRGRYYSLFVEAR